MERRAAIEHPPSTDHEDGGLAEALRSATQRLHVQAERTGLVGELLRGRGSRAGYAHLLRNLLPAYQALERGLEHHRGRHGVGRLARPELYRSEAMAADLAALLGDSWAAAPLLPAGARYARTVARAAAGDGFRLIAHAYVRYLGDLSGGQILKRLLQRSLGLEAGMLTLYDFPAIPDAAAYKDDLRAAIDAAGREIAEPAAVIDEARLAFCCNIELSLALARAGA